MIEALIFSYKNKNLKKVIDQLILNTSNKIFITVFDKHDLDRSSTFSSADYSDYVKYTHIVWDELEGPAEYKANMVNNNSSKYFLMISDDILVSKSWDVELLSFINNNKTIISGAGKLSITQKNPFYLEKVWKSSDEFSFSNFINRNFIFGETLLFKDMYPSTVKYFGDEEIMSLNLFNAGVKVCSAPSWIYQDLLERTIEKKYTTFSLEHNYNSAIEILSKASQEFLDLIGLTKSSLHKLPYDPDDVAYNPYLLDFQLVNSTKFVQDIKLIQ
jgi:hypothetical protein